MSSVPPKKNSQQELVAGRYQTSHIIGKGGMGKVVYGKHVDLQQEVAIKYLRINSKINGENAERRFCQEAYTYASVNHPNVVKLLDFERTRSGELRMVLEYVKGETLGAFMRRTGQCHPFFAIDIAIQIAQGLSAAHSKSIIHRDLKPENIMLSPLTRTRRHYHVKLLDFGIAKDLNYEGERYTAAGTVCGTPDYMSPEQARGLNIDTRSDVYSLGVLLFEMLAGRLPYIAQGKKAVMAAHCYSPIPLVSEFSEYPIPTILEDLLQSCLAKNAADRFQSVEELITALEHVAEREYDQVSPTKFNALTPTGEALRYNQHPARDLDLIQQESEIEIPINPSIIELQKLREEAFEIRSQRELQEEQSLASSDELRPKNTANAQSASLDVINNPIQVPIHVIMNDPKTTKAKMARVEDTPTSISEQSLAQVEVKVETKSAADAQSSAKDFVSKGIYPEKMGPWLSSMWKECTQYIEQGNTNHMMVALAAMLFILFSISISFQSSPTSAERSEPEYSNNEPFSDNEDSSIKGTKFETIIPQGLVEEKRSAVTPNIESTPSQDPVQKLMDQSKFKKTYDQANRLYLEGKTNEALKLLNKYPQIEDSNFAELKKNTELLKNTLTRIESISCISLLKSKNSLIHVNLIDHPKVNSRLNYCRQATPNGHEIEAKHSK